MLAPYQQAWPPDYAALFAWRQQQVLKLRGNANLQLGARAYYKTRPVEFIDHWCNTYDPRSATDPTKLSKPPLVLFKRQVELVEFLYALLLAEESGLIEKSRDMGATWVAVAFSVWAWLFIDGASIGWGSRNSDLVDRIGEPDSIFEKIRMTVRGLPIELLPRGFDIGSHCAFMRLVNPETNATIAGEIGDNIGRGGRKLIYFKDESAHYVHPEMIEASLMDNTRVQVDISSVNGTGNVFHRKREAGVDWIAGEPIAKGRTNVFVLDWRDHPEKDQTWYDARRAKAKGEGLLHKFAQEVDRDYAASVEGIIIDPQWVKAAIDAHITLGFDESGGWSGALDVADGGMDTNSLALRKGVVLKSVEEWGERDTGVTARRAVGAVKFIKQIELQYDCIGIGSGIKAETNRLSDEKLLPKGLRLVPWNAGAGPLDPDKTVIKGDRDSPTNDELFQNIKAQGWWMLARRFEKTYRAVRSKANDATAEEKSFKFDVSDLISLPSTLPLLRKIEKELSQPVFTKSARLKLMVDKTPEGTKSPNNGDSIMMAFWPVKSKGSMVISDELLAATAARR